MYTVAAAQRPEPPAGADRIFLAPSAVIVLDGASAFARSSPNPAGYVDSLGAHLRGALTDDPAADLVGTLAAAIEATARGLALMPGHSPSSTVAIARWSDVMVDLLVIGDTQIVTPHGTLRDDRLDHIGRAQQAAYRERLRSGGGYNEGHQALLVELQAEQARHRNQPDGYWIAEADPAAAAHSLTVSYPVESTPWMVLSTDGAYKPLDQLQIAAERAVDSDALADMLRQCQDWESSADPDGRILPRSKRHDDKAVVLLQRESDKNHRIG